ncbi:MAG: PH domain-containing protein [Betaproteobacteria bacterium]|nr:PH domain-containing protein [Betaproteobacteria bacterium]
MASHVESVLGTDEEIRYRAKIAPASYGSQWIVAAVFVIWGTSGAIVAAFGAQERLTFLGLALLALGAIYSLPPIVAMRSTELVITNRRVIAKFGLIRRTIIEMSLARIESLRVEQSLLGRLLNFGDIVLIGTDGARERISRIARPLAFRRSYEDIVTRMEAREGQEDRRGP